MEACAKAFTYADLIPEKSEETYCYYILPRRKLKFSINNRMEPA